MYDEDDEGGETLLLFVLLVQPRSGRRAFSVRFPRASLWHR